MPEPQSTPDAIVTIEPSLAGIAREAWDACANPGWSLTPAGPKPIAGPTGTDAGDSGQLAVLQDLGPQFHAAGIVHV